MADTFARGVRPDVEQHGPVASPVADLRLSAAVLAMMVALAVAFGGLISGAVWWLELLLASVVVLGVAAGWRALRLPRGLAPVVSLVALVLLVTVMFAPHHAVLGIFPTAGTVSDFSELVARARIGVYNQGVPADPLPEFLFLITVAGGVIAWVGDVLAVVLRRPAFMGVVVAAALIAPASLLNGGISPLGLVLCVVAYLLLLRADVRAARGSFAETGTSLTIAAGAIVIALVIGTTAPGFQQVGRQAIPAAGVLFGEGVSPLIDLGADLRRPVPITVIDYSTTSSTPGYLQMTTLDEFSGAIWRHDPSKRSFFSSSASIGLAPGQAADVKTKKVATTIQVHNLTSSWLPAPYPVSRVTGLNGTWGWEADDLTIAAYTDTTVNQTYTVTTKTVEPTADQLRSAGRDYPESVLADLQVPSNSPAIIAATAREVTAGATTPYDKAVALQAYFHDGDFRYSLNAPKNGGYDGDTPGTIATFLEKKAGYCVHFAAAMTMMARILGIPARIAVGYLPGTETGVQGNRALYEVSSQDLHAWPELYFPGVGWTPFEPTVGRGTVPDYEDVVPSTPVPTDSATPSSGLAHSNRLATDAPSATTSTSSGPSAAVTSSSSVAAVVLVLVGLVLTPALVRRRQRSRRLTELRGGESGASVAWAELRSAAIDLGLSVPDTETPRAFARRLRRTWEDAADGPPDARTRGEASAAISRLLAALERDRFGPHDDGWPDPGIADDVIAVETALAATAGWSRRARATMIPVSLLEGRLRAPSAAGTGE